MSTGISDVLFQENRTLGNLWSVCRDDVLYASFPVLAGVLVYLSYMNTHPFPTHFSGLYLQAADAIRANGYQLPQTIPGYTSGGIPFGYPPLMMYVAAVLLDFGISGITIATVLPGLLMTAYLVPMYLFARDLFHSRRQGAFATALVALHPMIFYWHLVAGGWVRSAGFFWLFCGLFTGLRLFRTHERKWIVASVGFFSLTILTHPVCAFYFVVSFTVLWLAFDHSIKGLLTGAVVGLGGILLITPWLFAVISSHDYTLFLTPFSSVHGGYTTNLLVILRRSLDMDMLNMFAPPWDRIDQTTANLNLFVWHLGTIGLVYLLLRRKFFLPLWFITTMTIIGQERFQSLMFPFLATPFLFEVVVPGIQEKLETENSDGEKSDVHTLIPSAFLSTTHRGILTNNIAVIVLGLVLFTAAGGSVITVTNHTFTPQALNSDQVDAMTWAHTHTPKNATFVSIGGRGEWLPYLSKRTLLVTPWGTEWTGNQQQNMQEAGALARCSTPRCITNQLQQEKQLPDYLYVSKSINNVGLIPTQGTPPPTKLLDGSGRYQLAYENDDAAIYKVDNT